MKNWLNNLTGKTQRRIDNIGAKLLSKYDDEASKYLGLGRFSSKSKEVKRDLERIQRLKGKSKKNRLASAGVLTLGTGAAVGTYAYGKNKDKNKEKRLKASLVDKADSIYRKGQQDYETRMLQDPKFPLPVKLKLLESRGVIKQASLKGVFSLGNIRKAKTLRDDLGKEVTRLSKVKADDKVIREASDLHTKAQKKVTKERLKSYGTYGGLLGASGYAGYKYINKQASVSQLPLIGAGAGAVAGPVVGYLHPEIDSTKRNLIESSVLGAIVGGSVGIGAAYGLKRRGAVKKAKTPSAPKSPKVPDNTKTLEEIPVT
jgi:hypothetical protein